MEQVFWVRGQKMSGCAGVQETQRLLQKQVLQSENVGNLVTSSGKLKLELCTFSFSDGYEHCGMRAINETVVWNCKRTLTCMDRRHSSWAD